MTGNDHEALEATLDLVAELLDREPSPSILDDLKADAHPAFCSWCGERRTFVELHRYRFLGRDERETPVVLCGFCEASLQSDPRRTHLVPLVDAEPLPGIDPLCIACCHRRGLRCGSPLAKLNGGPGIKFHGQRQVVSSIVRLDPWTRDRHVERREEWKPADWCDGRQVAR